MSEQANTPVQQVSGDQLPTGPGSSTPSGSAAPQTAPQEAPVQQVSPQTQQPPQTPQPTQQQQEDSWQARYQGLQRVHQQTVQDLRALRQEAAQAQQHAGTLEQQLQQVQTDAQTAQQQLDAQNTQLLDAQREAGFWSLVNQEYPDLAQFAALVQRMPTPDQQRQVLNQLRERLSTQVAQQANQQVAQNFAGATPGASPVPGGNPLTPSYGEVMEHALDWNLARNNPEEHQRWMEIWENHPEMTHESLGQGPFIDPFASHIDSRAQMLARQSGQQQPNQRQVPPDAGLGQGVWRTS
ncbi:MAG: hypothetical protein GWN58_27640 [Anaerolineae bacterium]|nr:hypothetical protein [Anaerolineae bacterium]